jgi:hypothetical protein
MGMGITVQMENITPASVPQWNQGTTGTNHKGIRRTARSRPCAGQPVRSGRLQTRKMYRSKRSQESHRKRDGDGIWGLKQDRLAS